MPELQPYGIVNHEDPQSKGEEKDVGDSSTWRQFNISALIVLTIMVLLRGTITLTMQLAGGKINIFEQNSLRSLVTFLLAAGKSICCRMPVTVKVAHFPQIFQAAFFNWSALSCLYFAVSFMPIGNTEAMYFAIYICISTGLDFVKGNIHVRSALSTAFVIIGLIFLWQPWHREAEIQEVQMIPCDYWEGNALYEEPSGNFSADRNHSYSNRLDNANYTARPLSAQGYFIFIMIH